MFLSKTTTLEKPTSTSSALISQIKKIGIAQFINTAIISLLLNMNIPFLRVSVLKYD
jgi:hypothetical protein